MVRSSSTIRHQAPRYLLIGVILYRRGVNIILHRCLTIDEADRFLNDYHIDACSCHLLGMSNAQKVIRQGTSSPRCFMTASTLSSDVTNVSFTKTKHEHPQLFYIQSSSSTLLQMGHRLHDLSSSIQ
jgi:superfamily II DNA/RNA helicase